MDEVFTRQKFKVFFREIGEDSFIEASDWTNDLQLAYRIAEQYIKMDFVQNVKILKREIVEREIVWMGERE